MQLRRSGPRRAGEHARAQAQRRTREYRARFACRLAALGSALGAVIVLVALLEPNTFLRGLVLGAGLATIGWGLTYIVLTNDGSYTWRRGADAEELTADLLTRALPGWTLTHGMYLVAGDIDHVVCGPGGVIAVETKWTSVDWESRAHRSPQFVAALAQARQSAVRVQQLLASKGVDVDVKAMLIVWGRGAPHFAHGLRDFDGVLVLEGRARPDLASRLTDDIEAADLEEVRRVLSAQN